MSNGILVSTMTAAQIAANKFTRLIYTSTPVLNRIVMYGNTFQLLDVGLYSIAILITAKTSSGTPRQPKQIFSCT